MFVDPELLKSGANESHRASAYAQHGAAHLEHGLLPSGMFGDFGAGEMFSVTVNSARTKHVRGLNAHREALTVLGAKAEHAAAELMAMDENNAAQLRAARCDLNT
jgi:hypothetical protein